MIEEWTASSILAERLGVDPDPEWPEIWITVEMPHEDQIVTFQCGNIVKARWQDGISMISHSTGIAENRVSEAVKTTIGEWVIEQRQ